MDILIITRSDDNESINLVTRALAARGANAIRLDTDLFPTSTRLEIRLDPSAERRILINEQGRHDLAHVAAVWYRRFHTGASIPATLEKQLRHASILESRATLFGLIADIDAFHLDPVYKVRRAGDKQLQLSVARRCGLLTPRTLISNDPDAVRDFAAACSEGLVAKMMSSFAVYEEGLEKVVFTNRVKPDDLRDLSGLNLSPMTFQELIPKQIELRTIVVGRRAFTASIDSQASQRSTLDWRRDGAARVGDWKHYTLPPDVEAALMRLMDFFGLNYGAVDFILTPDGRHVFLEVNPVGEFFWLEQAPGLPLGDAIADVLTDHAPRR